MSVRTEIDRIIGAVEAAHTAIVEKGGTTVRPYLVGNLADAINTIPVSADPKLQTKTVSPATSTQTVKPDSGYDGLSQVTVNAMPTATQATPSISVSSGGLITASATQSAGYVAAGTKKATKQLTVQAAQTITPGTTNKTIASGRYLTGAQTIKGDSNLVAGNIKSGVSIFGVAGTFEGSGGGGGGGGSGSVETCTVTFISGITPPDKVSYSSLDIDGAITSNIATFVESGYEYTAVLNNVVCGSALTLNFYAETTRIEGTATQIYGERYFLLYKAPNVANENCIIMF